VFLRALAERNDGRFVCVPEKAPKALASDAGRRGGRGRVPRVDLGGRLVADGRQVRLGERDARRGLVAGRRRVGSERQRRRERLGGVEDAVGERERLATVAGRVLERAQQAVRRLQDVVGHPAAARRVLAEDGERGVQLV